MYNSHLWVVIHDSLIQYSHPASPLRFGNQFLSTSVLVSQPRAKSPRCQVPLFRQHDISSLPRLHPTDSLAQALESDRCTQLVGSTLPVLRRHVLVPRSRQNLERAQDLLRTRVQPRSIHPQRVVPAPSGPLWRCFSILQVRLDELPELKHGSGRFALKEFKRPALRSSAAASPADGRTCLRSINTKCLHVCVCLCQSVRLKPKRAAKEPPRGDHQMGPTLWPKTGGVVLIWT